MTPHVANDPHVALGIDTDPRLDLVGADDPATANRPLPGIADLDAQLTRLDAVVAELAVPPVDRDPVLWAAHEFARCAQLLIGTRVPGDETPASDLGPALDHARSAMLSLTMARRHEANAGTVVDPPIGG
jgi:hypothetical protein